VEGAATDTESSPAPSTSFAGPPPPRLTSQERTRLRDRALKMHAPNSNSPTPPIASAHFAQTYPRSFQHAYTQPTAPLPSGLETNGSRSQDRSGVGVDPHQAGTAGSHGRATLRPGSGDRLKSVAAPRARRPRAGKAQSLDAISARRSQVGWPKAVQVINPDRVAGRYVLTHAVYRHIGCAVPPRRSPAVPHPPAMQFSQPIVSIK
jgi:hypothetical protein